MSRKDPMHDTPATPSAPFGPLDRALERFITWIVVLPFLPVVLYERWRRNRERLTPAGAAKERAVQDVMRKLRSALREVERTDRAAPPSASAQRPAEGASGRENGPPQA